MTERVRPGCSRDGSSGYLEGVAVGFSAGFFVGAGDGDAQDAPGEGVTVGTLAGLEVGAGAVE
jgi:hypothetical protein